jgi:hypothetical protein
MSGSYLRRLHEAMSKGMTDEDIEQQESLECAIAYHQNKIEEYEEEIKTIEKMAKARLKNAG